MMETNSDPPYLDSVDSLLALTVDYCAKNLTSVLADRDSKGYYQLKSDLTLPVNICELLLRSLYENDYEINDGLLNIFVDTGRTRLCRLKLRDSLVTDEGVEAMTRHNLVELDLTNCIMVTPEICQSTAKYSPNLMALHVNNWDKFVHNSVEADFQLPRLKVLVARNLDASRIYCSDSMLEGFVVKLLESVPDLRVLDVSNGSLNVAQLPCLRALENLTTLIMFGCDLGDVQETVESLTRLKSLRYLDISRDMDGDRGPRMYCQPERVLRTLVRGLPNLVSLDISGTNLAGSDPNANRRLSHRPEPRGTTEEELSCPIVGLEGRSFDFLGLFQCSDCAGAREGIPAKTIASETDEEQLVVALEKYAERPKYVEKILDELFHLLRAGDERPVLLARQFRAIVGAMEQHLRDYHIQISASASLFYVSKTLDKKIFTTMKDRRRAVTCLLNAMEKFPSQDGMTRNCCLTLCNFNIPNDVRFAYSRVIRLLLNLIRPPLQEEFVRRVCIYLLNSLACQVDGSEKQLIGNLGAVSLMLDVITEKLSNGVCDEVMEVSWSTMWNITDETPLNCQRFLDGNGMKIFIECLEAFPEKNDLLRNMMGLMGNIAEVKYLRPQLMTPEFVKIFSELVASTGDGIEVSYNACGVLAHMLSDEPEYWTVTNPGRDEVCSRVEEAISGWALETDRNINYRSFEPILRLLSASTPCVQYWATWALCNLTSVYPQKYCELLRREGGLELLGNLLTESATKDAIGALARATIEQITSYRAVATSPVRSA